MSAAPARPAESGTGAVLERGLDTSNGLDFVRERLALVGKTLFLVSFGFYFFLIGSLVLVGGAPFVAVVTGPVAWPPRCQLDDGPGLAPDQPCQAVEDGAWGRWMPSASSWPAVSCPS